VHTIFAIDLGTHFFDVLKVHDRGSVNAKEGIRIELLFEAAHRLAQQVCL
jgi:hypothetical protein